MEPPESAGIPAGAALFQTGWVDVYFWHEPNYKKHDGSHRSDFKLVQRVVFRPDRARERGWNPGPEEQHQFMHTWDLVAYLLYWIEQNDPDYAKFEEFMEEIRELGRFEPKSKIKRALVEAQQMEMWDV